ncbi:hypothetical protein K6Y31_19955 [Motilimonas cestriensis]|uniref:Uncharacterized protein n=1 Tax=Motilimonas cestriensis TaxID=2742685 RepID=A0ABS8WDD1_9GAMM|nr:hypothetical protein [Motilimonas cestriensis]MCE2597052.1 hypothetical protein [Motilimonas cestriensis]
MLTVDVELKQVACQVVWVRHNVNAETYQYHVNGTGDSLTAQADRYGVFGSGRAAIIGFGYVKGIGKTSLVDNSRPYYSSGSLTITDAVVETIHLEAIYALLKNAIRPLAVYLTPFEEETNLEYALKSGAKLEDIPLDRQLDHGALFVRDIPIRIAHLYPMEPDPQKILDFLAQHNPELDSRSAYVFYPQYLEKVANNLATLFVNRFAIGTTAMSNLSVHGVPFDTASSSFLQDFRNCWVSADNIKIWDEPLLMLKDLTCYLMDYLGALEFSDINHAVKLIACTYDAVEGIWQRALLNAMPLLLGFSAGELDQKYTSEQVEQLKAALLCYIQVDTVEYDLFGGYNAARDAPKWVGLPFNHEFPALVQYLQPTSSEALNQAYLALNHQASEQQILACQRICMDRTPVINDPHLNEAVRSEKALGGHPVAANFNAVIETAFNHLDKIFEREPNCK